MTIEEKIKTLPRYIHKLTEPHRCEHCHERLYTHDDPQVITMFLQVYWNHGEWIVRYNGDGNGEMEQVIDPVIDNGIERMQKMIKENDWK